MARPEIKVSEECIRTFDAREEDGVRYYLAEQVTELRKTVEERRKGGETLKRRWQFQVRPEKAFGKWKWKVYLVVYDAEGDGDRAGEVTSAWV